MLFADFDVGKHNSPELLKVLFTHSVASGLILKFFTRHCLDEHATPHGASTLPLGRISYIIKRLNLVQIITNIHNRA